MSNPETTQAPKEAAKASTKAAPKQTEAAKEATHTFPSGNVRVDS